MIARIAYFDHYTPEQVAARGTYFRERFQPAISAQDGFIAGYFLHHPQGERIQLVSFTVWESDDHLQRGERRALEIAPMPPGMTYPDRVEIYEVAYRS